MRNILFSAVILTVGAGCAQSPSARPPDDPGAAALGLSTSSADAGPGVLGEGHEFVFDFGTTTDGWVAEFADYGKYQEDSMALDAGHRSLPYPLVGGGFMLTGDNKSDDLFMYLYRRVDGLEPKASYTVEAEVTFATEAPSGCSGIGGSPGEDVTIKVGATDHLPIRSLDANDIYRVNVDKGNQSSGGTEMAAVGHAGNENYGCEIWNWELKTLADSSATVVTADENGSVWLLIGSDSGHEGPTTLYYTQATFRLVPAF